MSIQQMVEKNNYVIILDTNILLNIYRYSPEFSQFALNCLRAVKEHVMLPATVRLEYGKHCRAEFGKMRNRVKNAGNGTSEQIKLSRAKVLKSCENLERLEFPDVDELRDSLSVKFDELQKVIDDFFQDRIGLRLISRAWENTDYLQKLVAEWEQAGAVLPEPSQEDIYAWCEEGEERYKKQVPPGFKDAKDKDGVRKYSDLIWWKEVLRFADKEKKNVILVTDDVKADWWETVNGKRQLHQGLMDEFSKTGRNLCPFVSRDFYSEIAADYDVEKTDAVEIALQMTDNEYCEAIAERVFDRIESECRYSDTDYIDVSSAHIGSEGIEELEITGYDFISGERIDRDDNVITYQFEYEVTAEGVSYDYWGRDEDTREIVRSYGTEHMFEGTVTVEVTREADIFLDFEDDSTFDTVKIVSGELVETNYKERWPEEETGELGNCPDCGCPLNPENDWGGFCVNCAENH